MTTWPPFPLTWPGLDLLHACAQRPDTRRALPGAPVGGRLVDYDAVLVLLTYGTAVLYDITQESARQEPVRTHGERDYVTSALKSICNKTYLKSKQYRETSLHSKLQK